MNLTPLLPAGFFLYSQLFSQDTLTIGLMATVTKGNCPLCQTTASRVHSFYQRTLTDLPMSGKPIKLLIRLRKFFCPQISCPRKVFAQSFNLIFKPYARRLLRANQQIQDIGLFTGAKPAARLCHLIGQPVSASTVLRVIKKTLLPIAETPKRLGIDDFAFKNGRNYGTILVDLDQRKPIDLLPDREAKTLEEWLKARPGIGLVTRDRSSVYAAAVTSSCPDAVQPGGRAVADRWHLLKNLSETVERFLDGQRLAIREAAQAIEKQPVELLAGRPIPLAEIDIPKPFCGPIATELSQISPIPTEKRYELYQRAKELQQQGHSIRAVAAHLGSSRNTVKKYFKQVYFVPKTQKKRANLLTYETYLRQRWQAGETSVKTLFEEIKAKGYNGGYSILAAFFANYPKTVHQFVLPPAQKELSYSSRRLSRLLGQPEASWPDTDRSFLAHLLNQNDSIHQVCQLSLRFRTLMQAKQADGFASWCTDAERIPALRGFVRGIRQDYVAVEQAFSSSWSNGQTEGQVNRLKTIKRSMYGRASFELLRLRVLATIRTPPQK